MQPYSESWFAMAMPVTITITITLLATLFLSVSVSVSVSVPLNDKIEKLPDQPAEADFQQFGGYITIDEKQGRALFYYFVEARAPAASSKPLVLWLNGGPGCSSLGAGAFVEHGPFKVNGQTLVNNHYSWNTEANILYLESPAGVGFSYSANTSFYSKIDDAITEYRNKDFYVTGESYGGHYVPQLAQLIIKSKVNIKLKGIAIGNPLLDLGKDFNARDEYLWSHGVVSDSAYKLLTSVCNSSRLVVEAIQGTLSSDCQFVVSKVSKELSNFIDYYNVIGDVCPFTDKSQATILIHPLTSLFYTSSSTRHQTTAQSHLQETNGGNSRDACSQENTAKYLNRKDVQHALHAQLIGITEWSLCNNNLDWYYDQKNKFIPMLDVVGSLVKSQIRVLVYSGDQDSVIPFMGTRTLVSSLAKALGLDTTVSYRAWLVDNQVGGWTQVYGNFLSFATIRGASHLAPETQPKRSLVLFKAFLEGKPLQGV
ncbi:serine carboxypeptidase-like 45 isoform X2 [Momordica charantia]|uniref:Carboxypeptidase n=1 Tax=Momordica charantia TaxID=3673 RepID=A0A6J1DW00_MOMCH|nr:serine carboxypeptidase-like 45 isoform X2 [Momordica charantia]